MEKEQIITLPKYHVIHNVVRFELLNDYYHFLNIQSRTLKKIYVERKYCCENWEILETDDEVLINFRFVRLVGIHIVNDTTSHGE